MKLELPHQQAVLKSPRYFPSPYGAKHGWVCRKTVGKLELDEVRTLCLESYRRVATKRMLAALEGGATAAPRAPRSRTRARRSTG